MAGLRLFLEKAVDGGRCLARHEGQVIFVHGGLPGETVDVRVHDAERSRASRFLRADVIRVLEASPHRVPDRRRAFARGDDADFGGMEYAHVSLAESRRLKAEVVAEQFQRLAGIEVRGALRGPAASDPLEESAVPHEGLTDVAWRTRVQLAVTAAGELGAHRARSHEIVPVSAPPLGSPGISGLDLGALDFTGIAAVEIAQPDGSDHGTIVLRPAPGAARRGIDRVAAELAGRGLSVLVPAGPGERRGTGRLTPLHGEGVVTERPWRLTGSPPGGELPDIAFTLPADGFWQVHARAPALLAARVRELAGPLDGVRAADLYCGAGLLTMALAAGGAASTLGIESSRAAVDAARGNARAAGLTAVFAAGRVEQELSRLRELDTVVLDPPRAGAGKPVVEAIAGSAARRVIYVSCDAATLARDVAYFRSAGFEMSSLEVIDLFPLTGHVECVAALDRAS